MDGAGGFLLLGLVGLIAGTLNTVAGGGSFLTLPVLILFGLPAGVANGTNRIGILFQNVASVWRFDRYGVLDRRAALWAAGPATLGAALGTWAALMIPDSVFQRLLALLMVIFALLSLWAPRKPERLHKRPRHVTSVLAASFFAAGIYAGFVQAGVGFLILAVTSLAGLDLVRGNAVKVLAILCATVLSLSLFAWQGRVDWALGLSLATGQTLGGALGARLTVLRGHAFVRAVVTE